MKAILVNGSPHENGCTYTALQEVAGALEKSGVETEIFWLGKAPITGCVACGYCYKAGECVVHDTLYDFVEHAKDADAFVFGCPVHFSGATPQISALMSRMLYSGMISLAGKPVAAIVSCRRGGASAAYEQLNQFFGISGALTIGSQYWNAVHGNTPDEVRQDLEGLQIMRTLGNNIAWTLKCIKAGEDAGIFYPELEPRVRTNFIGEGEGKRG